LGLDASYSDAGILEVVVKITPGQVLPVLWHTILLPLIGFLAGATLGMSLIGHELASIILSGVGLVIGIMATRQLNPDVVCLEPALDNKQPEMILQ
jgi:positive regulator of sigma E activity